ncbi:primosomal protein N' [Clostridium felsineum]|uniref:primosomal protein N' n=1 Tax=Clostridium felsineum TaxID=36839 RepID=UPI00098C09D6|nr:primosomal protein N' [Clostridium felsineum]URZ16144.1 Primosomal protein N' [Clostridium felsineum DSM 794]
MYNFAGIIINNEVTSLDRVFTYKIPEELKESIKIGQLVKVPFGNANKKLYGFIINLKEENEENIKLKNISSIESKEPVITDKDLRLISYMKKKYLCTYIECIRLIIPTGIMKGMKPKTTDVVFLSGSGLKGSLRKDIYETIYKKVEENNGVYNRSQLSKKFNISLSSINTMIKHGVLKISEKTLTRYDNRVYDSYDEKKLNEYQEEAVNRILYSNKKKFLIHGVTGSGKTEIYMHLVKNMIEEGKQSIILVPEISLTPQMIERFKGRFGLNVAVFHSKLSDGERYDEWTRVKNGEVKVAVGARSALFLPFNNLGLIVIDEEHEGSYKSESDPKYSAIEVAEMKSKIEDCTLVLGSATPAIETYYKALKEEYYLITLDRRADGAVMPEVSVVDMREELRQNNKSVFSKSLYEAIYETLEKNEQIILFLNRRGYSTFVSCRKCGYVFKCKNCDVSMTYHNNKGYLICHYCGSTQRIPRTCPKCGSKYVKYFGAGTERIEREIKKLFPDARTVRMDRDTTVRKDSYERIYNAFKNKEFDILIGTQMIAKGLDFKDVTLVGVVAADLTLNLPDYKASERTFQLLCQVSGRSGRGSKKGKVIIQTYSPESYAIEYSAKNDYKSFFKEEIKLRHDMDYPPFNKLLLLNFSSKDEKLLIKNIQIVGDFLKNKAKEYSNIYILGPCPSPISKINEAYRWQIVVKGDIDYELASFIKKSIYELLKKVYNNIRISLDINPLSLL